MNKCLYSIAILIFSCSTGATATTYDAVSGFSATNPGVVWSYRGSRDGTISYLGTHYTNDPGLGTGWWSGMFPPYSGQVWVNSTGATQTHLTINTPTGTIGMDPEAYDWVSVDFTAPKTGTYEFNGQFTGIDTLEYQHFSEIIAGADTVFSALMNHYGEIQNFSETLYLAAGEAVSFRTLTGIGPFSSTTSSNLTTGLRLSVTFSAVPELESWAMMIIGLGMVGAAIRHRRNREVRIA